MTFRLISQNMDADKTREKSNKEVKWYYIFTFVDRLSCVMYDYATLCSVSCYARGFL